MDAPCYAPVVRHLGVVDYAATYAAMAAFTAARVLHSVQDAGTPDEIWVCAHPSVYTQGVAGRDEHLLSPGAIPVVRSNRGGQITYHGPGQIVVYPLVDLRRSGWLVRDYVRQLEEALIRTLAAFGVVGERAAGAPGVYVRVAPAPPREGTASNDPLAGLHKIAALGVKVSRHCSYHGLALNVAMDLSPYDAINPCGYAGLVTTDMAHVGAHADMASVTHRLVEELIAALAPRHSAG